MKKLKDYLSPYPSNSQMREESRPGEAYDETKDPEYMAEGGLAGVNPSYDPMEQAQDQEPSFPEYLGGIKKDVSKYGADQLMEKERQLSDYRHSVPYVLGDALNAGADAMMMGVARAGNPGFQQAYENREARNANEQLGTLKEANAMNLAQTREKMGLDAQDPNSLLSKSAQKAYAEVLKQMGAKDADIANMSASNIGDVVSHKVSLEKSLGDLALERAQLESNAELRGAQIKNEKEHQKAGEIEAAIKQLEDRGFPRKFIEDVLGLKSDTTKKLEEAAGLGGGEVPPPHGQTVKQNGRTYHWNGKKYE